MLKICDFSISAELGSFSEQKYLAGGEAAKSSNKNNSEDEDEDDQVNEINPNLLSANSSRSRFPITQCTPMFQCPEMLDENMDELSILREAAKIDVWSSGVTLYQLTTGLLPFEGQTIHQIFELIRSPAYVIPMPDCLDRHLTQLLEAMLERDAKRRASKNKIMHFEILKKEFLQQFFLFYFI